MSRDLAQNIEALRDAEEARTALQRRIDEELQPTIDHLTLEKARESAAKDKALREVRSTEQTLHEAQAQRNAIQTSIDKKDGEIEELERQIKALQTEIEEFPDTRAAREAEAERIRIESENEQRRMTEAAEAARTRRRQIVAAGLTGLFGALIFALLRLLVGRMDWTFAGGMTALGVIGAFFAPQLLNLLEQINPTAKRYWRPITITASLVMGGTIASLGVVPEHSTLMKVVLWVVETLGFGLLFQGFFESIRILVTETTVEQHDRKKKMAFGYIYIFLGGLLSAGIYNLTGMSAGAGSYLLNTLIGMSGMLGVGFIGVLLGWVATHIAATLNGLFPKMQKKHRTVDLWLRRCKAVALIISVVVGWIVGSGFAHGLSGLSNWIVAGVAWFGISTVFFLIEGKVLEACFLRSYRWYVLVPLLIGATVFATGTAFLSFGKVYHVASQGPRFAEAQTRLLNAENAFFSGSETSCLQYAQATSGDTKQAFLDAIELMKQAIEDSRKAQTYDELTSSAQKFQTGGAKASGCANRATRKLLPDVVVYPEPTPSDLSTQYWFGTVIEGTKVHEGSAKQAIVLVSVIDFLIVILSIFGWIFSSRRRQNGETDAYTGRIVSIVSDDDGNPVEWIVSLGEQSGLEINDALNVLDDRGDPIGSLVASRPLGNGAFICVASGKAPQAETDALIRMVS